MRWFLWYGETDPIFTIPQTQEMFVGMLNSLGAPETLIYDHIEPGQGHVVTRSNLGDWMNFVRADGEPIVPQAPSDAETKPTSNDTSGKTD